MLRSCAAREMQCLRPPSKHLKGRRDILRLPDFQRDGLEAESKGGCVSLARLQHGNGSPISHDR